MPTPWTSPTSTTSAARASSPSRTRPISSPIWLPPTIGAQNGSIQYDLAVENTPDADIVSLTKVTDIIGDLLNDKLDGAFIETAVAENYAKNYPELVIVCDVPYDVAGSAIGVIKGNDSLMKGVNEAIAAALSDGSMDKFVAEANELSAGNVYEGLLDENGKVAEG